MQARECWTALLNKATRCVQDAQAQLAKLQQTHQSLLESLHKVEQLYSDYHQQSLQASQGMQGMTDALNQRQFLGQLSELRARIGLEIDKSTQALRQQRSALLEADRERMKMQSMVDEDLRRQQAQAQRREQKTMDELGLRQFNLRHG
jgi:flagellar export protein FliJ